MEGRGTKGGGSTSEILWLIKKSIWDACAEILLLNDDFRKKQQSFYVRISGVLKQYVRKWSNVEILFQIILKILAILTSFSLLIRNFCPKRYINFIEFIWHFHKFYKKGCVFKIIAPTPFCTVFWEILIMRNIKLFCSKKK